MIIVEKLKKIKPKVVVKKKQSIISLVTSLDFSHFQLLIF
jgi:hypothetical protein